MRIFNITSIPTVQNSYVGSNKAERPILSNIPADSFTFRGQSVFPLKEITLNTAEKLYNTDYVPQIPPKKGYYRTFVIDKNTGEYVDLYVKKAYCRPRCVNGFNHTITKYCFYRKTPNNRLKSVGFVERTFDEINQRVGAGYMETIDKSLRGIGLRGQQLAIELMLEKGYKNVEIASAFAAYDFHYKCGFRPIDCYLSSNDTYKGFFIKYWQKILKTDAETIDKMIVYKAPNDKSEINLVQSMVKFAKFANENNRQIPDALFIPMKLSKEALKEWLNLAKLKPILR